MAAVPELDPPAVAELGMRLRENVRRAVKVSDHVLRDVLVAVMATWLGMLGLLSAASRRQRLDY